MRNPASITFLILGIAFLVMGNSGQRSFRTIGIAFLTMAVMLIVRQRRAGGSKSAALRLSG